MRGEHSPASAVALTRPTGSTNGAERIFPPALSCRNSRHVPESGRRTPTVRWPGVAELPATLLPPKTLVQPPAPGLQTCVWKYSKRPLWKKIACASAPYHGVSVTGLPFGSVTVM